MRNFSEPENQPPMDPAQQGRNLLRSDPQRLSAVPCSVDRRSTTPPSFAIAALRFAGALSLTRPGRRIVD
jgi:hypothetical protein